MAHGVMSSSVTSILEIEKSKRRLIELEDDKTIQIKLWGNKSNLHPVEGESVLFKCLTVDIFKETFSLNSTPLTTYQVSIIYNTSLKINKVKEHVSIREANTIYIEETIFRVPTDVMDIIFPLRSFVDGTKITGRRAGSTLKSVTKVTLPDQEVGNPNNKVTLPDQADENPK
ncbi:uncharacterized protein LOC134259231 [Saccostrea cucullata]|uniref:uncharacterized protein LOC134259231 n=1 Tax=Saccostrea cuccullata TaxID=36930 RepID=UPI002ECFFF66